MELIPTVNRGRYPTMSKSSMVRRVNVGGALVCLVPLTWFSGNTVINSADFSDPFNPALQIGPIISGWSWSNFGQLTNRDATLLFPYDAFWWIFRSIGFTASLVQRFWFIALFLLGYLAVLRFVAVLTRGNEISIYAGPSIAILYLFNSYTLSQWWSGHDIGLLSYYTAPLWLAEIYLLLNDDRGYGRRYAAIALTSLLFAPSFVDLSAVSYIVFPTLLMVIIVVSKREAPLLRVLKRVSLGAVFCGLINLWWIVPLLRNLGGGVKYAGSSQNILSWPNLSVAVPFSEFVRGSGYWGFYAGYQGIPYYRFATFLRSPLVQVLTFAIVALIPLAAILFRRSMWTWFALATYAIALDISSALNGPLRTVNRWMFLNVPGFFVFRSTYEKFDGLLFLSVIICAALLACLPYKPVLKAIVAAAAVLFSVISIAPMIDGGFSSPHLHGESSDLHIPKSYDKLLQWTTARTKKWPGEMLVLPQMGYISTTWGLGGGDVLPEYSAIPTLVGSPGQTPADGPTSAATIEAATHFTNKAILQSLGIDLVLVRTDINYGYYPGTPSAQFLMAELSKAGFALVAKFGFFRIYSVGRQVSVVGAYAARPASSISSLMLDPSARIALHNVRVTSTAIAGSLEGVQGSTWIVVPFSSSANWRLNLSSPTGKVRIVTSALVNGFETAWLISGSGKVDFLISVSSPFSQIALIAVDIGVAAAFILLLIRKKNLNFIEPRTEMSTQPAIPPNQPSGPL